MEMTTTTVGGPHPGLLDWLADHHIDHEVHQHDVTFTASATARVEGVAARTSAKVVGVACDDGRTALLVLDALDHVDLRKACRSLAAREVRLLREPEIDALASGCEAGAMPAVGALFGLMMYADRAICDEPDISFNAGNHRFSVRAERAAWERASGVVYTDLAQATDTRPVWERSVTYGVVG